MKMYQQMRGGGWGGVPGTWDYCCRIAWWAHIRQVYVNTNIYVNECISIYIYIYIEQGKQNASQNIDIVPIRQVCCEVLLLDWKRPRPGPRPIWTWWHKLAT